jgi:hypothetical protein
MFGTTENNKMRNGKGTEGHGKEKKGEEEVKKGVKVAIHRRGD